jgi:hypothetical protein
MQEAIQRVKAELLKEGIEAGLIVFSHDLPWADVVIDLDVRGYKHRVSKIMPTSWFDAESMQSIGYIVNSIIKCYAALRNQTNARGISNTAYSLSDSMFFLGKLSITDGYILSKNFGRMIMDAPPRDEVILVERLAVPNGLLFQKKSVPLSEHSYLLIRSHWEDFVNPIREDSVLICNQHKVLLSSTTGN